MQEFIHVNRLELKSKDAQSRIKDFKEIYFLYEPKEASSQSSRCIQCGDPFCHDACPLHNYIPYWLKFINKNNDELAFKLSNETNPFPEITGRVCPQDKLCEGACTLNDGYGAISIGAIETYISENGFKNGMKPEFSNEKIDKKVAIIGSGPASIATATYLLRSGVEVCMYEKDDVAGGLLVYGIPSFKLQKEVVKRRIDFLVEAGMSLHVNSHVGEDVEFEKLQDNFDAIFLGIGSQKARKLNIAGENALGVFEALEFLKQIQKANFNNTLYKNLKDKKVLIIGGGDTAMDCARSSIRCEAKSVTCVYRRDKMSMGGSKKEFKNALDEGVEFLYNVSPKEILVNDKNEVIGLNLEKTLINDGKVQVLKQSEFRLECDVVIYALGFNADVQNFLAQNAIQTDESGKIIIDENYETTCKGVYAGGDCQRGSHLVVTAAADGKKAAKCILKALGC